MTVRFPLYYILFHVNMFKELFLRRFADTASVPTPWPPSAFPFPPHLINSVTDCKDNTSFHYRPNFPATFFGYFSVKADIQPIETIPYFHHVFPCGLFSQSGCKGRHLFIILQIFWPLFSKKNYTNTICALFPVCSQYTFFSPNNNTTGIINKSAGHFATSRTATMIIYLD